MPRLAALFIIGSLFCCSAISPAHAHSQSSSRVALGTEKGVPQTLSVDVALIDLLHWIDLDSDGDARIVWGEVLAAKQAIFRFITDDVRITAGEEFCNMAAGGDALSLVSGESARALRVALQVQCPAATEAGNFRLRYGLFFDANPAHRALLRVTGEASDQVYLLTSDNRELRLTVDQSRFAGAGGFVREGLRHILSGYDHLVFLLLLILPAAGVGGMRSRPVRIGAIVTAFTVAHSITLAAAITGAVHLPARPVEIGIAASVVLAALMNVVRPLHALGAKIAFTFGLLHGFGFAGALAELNLGQEALWPGLLAFNIGIELGQLAVVALILPVLALASASVGYRTLVVPSASFACAVLGVVWTAARL
jgi:hypothetical protein